MTAQYHHPENDSENSVPQGENNTEDLSTESPLSEKDEVKEAEERTNEKTKEDA